MGSIDQPLGIRAILQWGWGFQGLGGWVSRGDAYSNLIFTKPNFGSRVGCPGGWVLAFGPPLPHPSYPKPAINPGSRKLGHPVGPVKSCRASLQAFLGLNTTGLVEAEDAQLLDQGFLEACAPFTDAYDAHCTDTFNWTKQHYGWHTLDPSRRQDWLVLLLWVLGCNVPNARREFAINRSTCFGKFAHGGMPEKWLGDQVWPRTHGPFQPLSTNGGGVHSGPLDAPPPSPSDRAKFVSRPSANQNFLWRLEHQLV